MASVDWLYTAKRRVCNTNYHSKKGMSSNILGKRAPAAASKANKPEKKLKTGNSEGKPVVKQAARVKKDDDESEEISGSETLSQGDSENNENPDSQNKSRGQNNLGTLTKRFIELLNKEEENGGLDLKKAEEVLGVKKRRIYDITNVLEGISALEKVGKSRVRWAKNKDPQGQLEEEKRKHDEEVEKLEAEEKQLDAEMARVQQELQALLNSEEAKKHGYVTIDDIKAWAAQSTGESEDFFVISANNGTRVEVEDLPINHGNNEQRDPSLPFGMKFRVPEGQPLVHLIQRRSESEIQAHNSNL